MVTFLDQNQRRYGVRMTYDIKQSVNGERSLSGKISEPQSVLRKIDRGWRLLIGDEYYVVTYIKPHDKGRQLEVEFDAVHQFFWDFSKSSVHTSLNDGSHTFEEYLHFIFDGSGYSFRNEVKRYAFEKQSFGYKNRLSLFNDVVKQAGVEFVVHGRVVRILDRSGSDLTTVVRKNFNMNELKIEKNVKEFATFQAGFGAWNDKDDHSKGRLSVNYRSPLADEYGVIETDPFVDERYTDRESLLNKLKSNVDSSYEISVQIDMEDLTKAGYPYTQPRCGDYIMAINDVLGFRRRIRIVSFTSSYDIRGRLISHKITCGSISAVEKSVTKVSALSAKIGQAQIETAEAYKAALEALVATNGKNKNYWGDTFPTDDPPGTLIKGDQLYYQNGEKTELYVWNGLEWQKAKLGIDEEEFEKEIAEIGKQFVEQERFHNDKVAELVAKAGVAESTADEAKRLAEKANADLTKAQERSNSAIQGALSEARRLDQEERKETERAILAARNKANEEARRLISLSERALQESINDLSTEVTRTNDAIKLKADKATVDSLTGKVSQAEASLRVQAGEIASRVKNSDFDKEKEKLRTAETNIRQLGEKITTEISRTVAKIPTQIGGRNLFLNSKFNFDLKKRYSTYNLDDSETQTQGQLMATIDRDSKFRGTNTLKIVSTFNGKRNNQKITFATGGDTRFSTEDEMKNQSVMISFWAKASVANTIFACRSGFRSPTKELRLSTEWTYYSFQLTENLNSNATNEVIMHVWSQATVWIALPKVEIGTISTDYTEAPEDLQTIIESAKTTTTQTAEGTRQLSTKLAQAENKISRQETQVNQLIGDVSSKVSQTDYNNLKKSVDSHTTEINQTKSSIKLKADRSQVDDLSSRFRAELQVTNDAINAKVSKTEFNSEKNRVTNAETRLDTLAGQISTKLSRTEVNQLIDTKGFITNSTFTNTIEQTERGLTARITQVETRIPSNFSHRNVMRGTSDSWGAFRDITIKENWTFDLGQVPLGDQTGIYPDTKVNLFVYVSADNIVLDESVANKRMLLQGRIRDSSGNWTWTNWSRNHPFFNKWSRNLNTGNNYTLIKVSGIVTREMYQNSKGFELQIRIDGAKSGKFHVRALMVTTGDIAPDYWSPAPEDFATTTALHEVRDTVDGHTRTLTAQGRSISQVTQTAEGIVSRVANTESSLSRLDGRANFVESALNSTKTEVSQLAGSWAVKNLTNSGTVLNQLNLNKDGSVKIDGSLVQITGRTYIQDGVISSAKIGNLDAGKITTGTLDAHRVTIVNMDASNIVTGQMSANRIRGGTISSLNDRSQINLQNGRFYVSDNEAGFFRVDSQASTMGLKFINYNERINGSQRKVSRVILGGDRRQEGSDSNFGWDKGGFTGIVISTVKGAVSTDGWQVDDVQLIGDRVVFSHSYYADRNATNLPQQGWEMYNYVYNSPRKGNVLLRPYMIDKNQSAIETGNLFLYPRKDKSVNLLEVLRELKVGFVHIKNAGFSDAAYNAIVSSINKLSSLGI
ncbi:hypothetical protein JEQ21_07830 [Streptococcus sp. 121]|uniref:phage tail protein n=1 Tax=Streptococcus sp. 121 TaxID=2797637 RepID=UPI0018F0AFA8|nr:phage tail protein [Streptococcus sp. 121]MBJ6746362.1 hypothetical protein [Streptococcus sp. 121]